MAERHDKVRVVKPKRMNFFEGATSCIGYDGLRATIRINNGKYDNLHEGERVNAVMSEGSILIRLVQKRITTMAETYGLEMLLQRLNPFDRQGAMDQLNAWYGPDHEQVEPDTPMVVTTFVPEDAFEGLTADDKNLLLTAGVRAKNEPVRRLFMDRAVDVAAEFDMNLFSWWQLLTEAEMLDWTIDDRDRILQREIDIASQAGNTDPDTYVDWLLCSNQGFRYVISDKQTDVYRQYVLGLNDAVGQSENTIADV